MPRALVHTGMELEYDTFGSSGDPALLLIMGFTAQMTAWEPAFCQLLADGGRYVIRFDNRDCGLSTKLDGQVPDPAGAMTAAFTGTESPPQPYLLSDMADDAVGLLDALGIEKAHILGASMGGMIAQTIAIDHPDRVLTLTSVMSTPGEIEVGQPSEEAMIAIMSPPAANREEYIATSPRYMVWQSKKYRNEARTKELAARDYDRSSYPEGAPRQMAAIYASGSRTEGLKALDVPTLVIHGRDDQLITPSAGFRTAELVPGAHLLFVADMGHDMPEPLWPLITDVVLSHTSRV
ncbi:MAG TPA: alpha/beta hydrolase [Ilumatobacteraceae bacterium]|nr:alpha/beta hydrolase [Ilumatobacteraceae bacterium]